MGATYAPEPQLLWRSVLHPARRRSRGRRINRGPSPDAAYAFVRNTVRRGIISVRVYVRRRRSPSEKRREKSGESGESGFKQLRRTKGGDETETGGESGLSLYKGR